MHPSTERQNHLLEYSLINYDVQLASFIPSSDIHLQKVSMEFVNPHALGSRRRRTPRDLLLYHGSGVVSAYDYDK